MVGSLRTSRWEGLPDSHFADALQQNLSEEELERTHGMPVDLLRSLYPTLSRYGANADNTIAAAEAFISAVDPDISKERSQLLYAFESKLLELALPIPAWLFRGQASDFEQNIIWPAIEATNSWLSWDSRFLAAVRETCALWTSILLRLHEVKNPKHVRLCRELNMLACDFIGTPEGAFLLPQQRP